MSGYGSIYAITNVANGKVYVGQTKRDVQQRFSEHLKSLRGGCHFNQHLQRAFDKHGEDNFEFTVVATVPTDDLNDAESAEIERIGSMNSDRGYNMRSGGEVSSVSDEVKGRISASLRERYAAQGVSDITRGKMSAKASGRWADKRALSSDDVVKVYTDDTRPHREWARLCGVSISVIRDIRYGRIYTDVTRSLDPNAWTAEGRVLRVGKAVVQMSLDGSIVRVWSSASEAESEGGFVRTSIVRCCCGTANQHRGFLWRRYTGVEDIQTGGMCA